MEQLLGDRMLAAEILLGYQYILWFIASYCQKKPQNTQLEGRSQTNIWRGNKSIRNSVSVTEVSLSFEKQQSNVYSNLK